MPGFWRGKLFSPRVSFSPWGLHQRPNRPIPWTLGPWAKVDPGSLNQGLVWVPEPRWWRLPCGPLDPDDPPSMQAIGTFSPGGKILNAICSVDTWKKRFFRLIVPRCLSQQSCGISRAFRSGTVSPRTFGYLRFRISKKIFFRNSECFDYGEDDGYSIR